MNELFAVSLLLLLAVLTALSSKPSMVPEMQAVRIGYAGPKVPAVANPARSAIDEG